MSIKTIVSCCVGLVSAIFISTAAAEKQVISGSACQAYKESDMAKQGRVLTRSEWGIINRSESKTVSIFCPIPSILKANSGAAVAVFYKKMSEPTKCWLIASTNIEKGQFRTGKSNVVNGLAGVYWLKVKATPSSTVVLKCNLKPQQMIRSIHVDHVAYPKIGSGAQ